MVKDSSLAKYIIEVSVEQAKLISLTLDIYSRMEGGQLEWVFSMVPWKYYENLETAGSLLKELQQLLTGKQIGNLGIGNVSEKSKMAFDLHQVIRHRLSWDEEPNGGEAVHFNKPMQWSEEPLAKIKQFSSNTSEKVYLIYAKDWNERDSSNLVFCSLSLKKAQETLTEFESEREIIGKNENGSPVYDTSYWIREEKLVN